MAAKLSIDTKRWLLPAALFVLNLFDTLSTAYFVGNGYAREVNPLMNALIEYSMAAFIGVKLSLGVVVAGVLALLYKAQPLARFATTAVVAVYTILAISHLVQILLFF